MKRFFVFLCLIYSTLGFNNLNMVVKFNRKKCLAILPLVYTRKVFAENERSIDELRMEANRIIEIIEAQKSSIDLPKLKTTNEIPNKSENESLKEKNSEIENIINNIFISFKNDDNIKSLENLKSFCSDSNYVKLTSTEKLKDTFNDSKYAILLGKFTKYTISDYRQYIDKSDIDVIEGYEVDTKVYADYNTMIYNSIQFDDMYYPKENDKSKLHYVVYRWNFIKQKNNKFKLESCYLVSNNK
jgi:hypothetical protein